MKRRGIKNLIIDFGGVLIDLDRQRCLENFRKLGLPDVEVMLDLYHQQDFFQKYEKGLITSAEFREVIRGKIGKPVTDAQIDDAWNSFLVSIPTFKLDLLLELRKKYVDNPPEGMTSRDIRHMSEEELLDMDYFLNDDELDDDFGEEGFYIF